MKDIEKLFDDNGDEYLKFDQIENKRSSRPDIHAILLLDSLFPGKTDMICAAEHDIFYLDVSEEQIETLTEEQVIELLRCGVHLDSDSLAMFA